MRFQTTIKRLKGGIGWSASDMTNFVRGQRHANPAIKLDHHINACHRGLIDAKCPACHDLTEKAKKALDNASTI